jgi:hypothetical protein
LAIAHGWIEWPSRVSTNPVTQVVAPREICACVATWCRLRPSPARLETRSMRKCVYRKQLDLETLVATRGPNFPLSRLESRLMCPSCGNRSVTVVFEPPSNAQTARG